MSSSAGGLASAAACCCHRCCRHADRRACSSPPLTCVDRSRLRLPVAAAGSGGISMAAISFGVHVSRAPAAVGEPDVGVLGGVPAWRPSPWHPGPPLHGIRTTAWKSPLGSIPDPAISPRLLMVSPSVTVRWEPWGTNLFRSIMRPPRSEMNPCFSMNCPPQSSRRTDDLAAGVHEVSLAARVTIDGSEVCHLAFAPEEGVESLVRLRGGAAGNLACVVHPGGDAEGSTEGAQVGELSPAPEEGVSSLISGQVG